MCCHIYVGLLFPVLHNPVPCRADGLLGDAHDAADGLVVHTHFVDDEEGVCTTLTFGRRYYHLTIQNI